MVSHAKVQSSEIWSQFALDFTFLLKLNWSCDIVIAVKGNTFTQIQDEENFSGSKDIFCIVGQFVFKWVATR